MRRPPKGWRFFFLQETTGFDVEAPTLRGNFFDAGVIGCGVQNIIVAKIQGNVPNPFNARFILSVFVGEKDAIPALQFTLFYVFTLLDLRARGDVKDFPCALEEDVLYEGRTIEFMHGKV